MLNVMRAINNLLKPFFIFTLVAMISPLVIYFEIVKLGREISEVSITEFTQHFFLFVTVVIFAVSAKKLPQHRSFYVLVAGFFACMLIREHDYYFDFIQHGFWFYPAIITAIATIAYTLRNAENFAESAAQFKETKAFIYLIIGLVVLLVFSRLFGTGSIWKGVMADNYQHHYKSTIQEGLELFGYSIICLSSIYHALEIKTVKK